MSPIKLLIVEDSAVARELLLHIFGSDPAIKVVGIAGNGEEAIEMLARCAPDVITMDIQMPKMDGYETTKRIMEAAPVPIVMVSSIHRADEIANVYRAMEAGAVAAVMKPPGPAHPDYKTMAAKMVDTVKLMSEVKVIRRWKPHPRSSGAAPSAVAKLAAAVRPGPQSPVASPAQTGLVPGALTVARGPIDVVAIGASTGGPQALHALLADLQKPFPAPILIAQHIAAGFLQGLADWLHQATGMKLKVAEDHEKLQAGVVYLAPDDFHMGVQKGCIALSTAPPDNGLRPSVAHLFRSVAQAYGARAAGVLLTGMGRDGALELKGMLDRGAITFAQDEKSCVVFGMPGEAARLNAAKHLLPPEKIAVKLNELVTPGLRG